jgi:hypothetical protein
MKFVILCPYGSRTGGPEALHQLCATLIKHGVDASLWYTFDSDLERIHNIEKNNLYNSVIEFNERNVISEDYADYKVPVLSKLKFTRDIVFIFPESYLHWMKYLHANVSVVWWLSVDNSFKSFARGDVNSNTLRSKKIIHAYQSSYARNFLNAMGFSPERKLTDYTPIPAIGKMVKKSIAINFGRKVIFDVVKLAKHILTYVDVELVLINGLSRAQVNEALANSYCYIDLGNFPGKDRMAREAILLNCIPVVLDVPGSLDYFLPAAYKIEINQIDAIAPLVDSIVRNYEWHLKRLDDFVSQINLEEIEFYKETAGLIADVESRF